MATVLDLTSLSSAILSLEESMSTTTNTVWFQNQSPIVQKTLVAGVIQNFEFVFEICVKMIRRKIEIDSDIPASVDKQDFRDLIRTAAEKGLINETEVWFTYRQLRNITSHTYDQNKARQVYAGANPLLMDAQKLLKKLTR